MQTNPIKAIKEYCLECCMENLSEVKACTATECALYAFRLGKNPYRAKKVLTEDQKRELAERLKPAKNSPELQGE